MRRKEVKGLDAFFLPPAEEVNTEERKNLKPEESKGVQAAKLKERKTEKLRNLRMQHVVTEKLKDIETEEQKERVNYYISSSLIEALDRVQVEIRSLTKKKITKSDIVEAALQQALKEFSEKKQDSFLVRVFKEAGMGP
jgi:hypothetical protein